MRKIHVVLFLFFFSLHGCIDYELIENKKDFKFDVSLNREIVVDSLKISKGKESVSILDALNVAQMFNIAHEKNKTRATFSSQIKKIRNTFPILDKQQDTIMHVINFEEGFTIVSATKKFFPIIASSEIGKFDLDNDNDNIDFWLNMVSEQINEHKKDTLNNRFYSYWAEYEKPSFLTNQHTTLRSSTEKTIDEWRIEIINEFQNQYIPPGMNAGSVTIYRIDEAKYIYPELAEDPYFKEVLESYPSHLEYAFVAVRTLSLFKTIDKLLTTKWNQRYYYIGDKLYANVYNKYIPNNYPAGCVPVALGQIFNYYRYPTNYADWNKIAIENADILNPNKDETAKLLAKFGAPLNMIYRESYAVPNFWLNIFKMNFNDLTGVRDYLNSLGFVANRMKASSNHMKVVDELMASRPVYMEGVKSGASTIINLPEFQTAHAWVCEGVRFGDVREQVTLYVPEIPINSSTELINFNPYTTGHNVDKYIDRSFLRYYMNWGWGGNKDGWFYSIADQNCSSCVPYDYNWQIITIRK